MGVCVGAAGVGELVGDSVGATVGAVVGSGVGKRVGEGVISSQLDCAAALVRPVGHALQTAVAPVEFDPLSPASARNQPASQRTQEPVLFPMQPVRAIPASQAGSLAHAVHEKVAVAFGPCSLYLPSGQWLHTPAPVPHPERIMPPSHAPHDEQLFWFSASVKVPGLQASQPPLAPRRVPTTHAGVGMGVGDGVGDDVGDGVGNGVGDGVGALVTDALVGGPLRSTSGMPQQLCGKTSRPYALP